MNQDVDQPAMVRKISKLSDVLNGAENTFGVHAANSRTLDFEVAP